eukprot:CAMPEP_0177735430 /NCGR_PEP_ID=MMETSP0484_2-20121128/24769_1 /TAXON_ID=354590 /ORGANISM="Rhodomonas lens, Strain RHODO" /LENGTH=82 /DNA_ID=CAMNT_0019248987 /DNA_START=26 /DNA_END=271 /DNA_ORIENTATION=+
MVRFQMLALGPLTPLEVITGRTDLPADTTCNPYTGWEPTFDHTAMDTNVGCKLHPDVIMNGGVKNAGITFEPGLWGISESGD